MLRDKIIPKPDKYIPLTDEANFLVYFADINQENMEQWYISALDVFRGTVDPSRIKGKVVFIGTSAAGLKDLRNTPLSGFRPGVEIHMNIYDQMKERVFLYRPNWAKGAEILFMSVFGFIIIFLSPFSSAFSLYFLLVSAITSGAFFGWHLFVQDGYLIDVLYPILVTFVILIINTILSYIRAEVDKKQIGDTLGMYVSPAYIEELAKNPDNLKLGGETKELSVMFTDIRNFTSISESLTPEELIRLMNGFLTPMSDLVMSNHGTIDKWEML